MGRDTIQLEDAVSTISGEYLLEFTSEYGIPEGLHPELPGQEETIIDFPEGKVGIYTKFFEFANYRIPLDGFVQFDKCPESCEGEDRTRPRAAHEVPLLTATATRVIDMEDVTEASESLGIPSPVEKSPLDFVDEDPLPVILEGVGTGGHARDEVPYEIPPVGNPPTTEVAPDLEPEAAAMGSLVHKRHRERGNGGANANTPPKVLRKDHASVRSEQSTHGGKSLTSMGIAAGSTFVTPTDAKSVSDLDLLSYASSEIPTGNVSTAEVQNLQSAESSESGKSTSVPSTVGSPKGIYQPGWGVTNSCRLDTPDACQDVVDHIVPPGYFSELRHMSNVDFLGRYNINLAQQVAMGSQLRLQFEQEVRLLKKARAQIARRD
ncbi:hypothetical protein Tco_1034917 [Tanacetum coccineum]